MTTEHQAPDPDSQPRVLLLTVKQAARMLGVGTSTLYGLITDGRIETVHIGRSARIPSDAITEFVARLRAGDGVGPEGRAPGRIIPAADARSGAGARRR